jgi:hypothetical protein
MVTQCMFEIRGERCETSIATNVDVKARTKVDLQDLESLVQTNQLQNIHMHCTCYVSS